MAENKLPFVEGGPIHRPTMFSGINYQFWKIRMKIFIEAIDQGIEDAIINQPPSWHFNHFKTYTFFFSCIDLGYIYKDTISHILGVLFKCNSRSIDGT